MPPGVNELITKDQIDRVVETIVQNVHPEKVILFGSYANGNPGEDSDLDLLVIKDMPQKRIQRGREIRKYLRGTGIPIDLLVYTPQEIEEWRDTKAAFITQIIDQGQVLYG
jgi:predicted nucleotidyltransferase